MSGPVVVPKLLTMDELAERLGVTPRHIRRLVAERRVPFLRVGRFIRFDPAKIATWLDSERVPGSRDLGEHAGHGDVKGPASTCTPSHQVIMMRCAQRDW